MQGVLDRFGQIEPKVLFCADGYLYGGKEFDSLAKARADARAAAERRANAWSSPTSARRRSAGDLARRLPRALRAARDRVRARFAFNHPLYILYSSGTTGVPKCIVHGAGGTLLQHLKEHRLHSDVQPGDRLFYFTTSAG